MRAQRAQQLGSPPNRQRCAANDLRNVDRNEPRLVNRDGQLMTDYRVLLSRAALPQSVYRSSWTYTDDHVNGDDVFGENAVFGDLPSGSYWVRAEVDGHEFAEPVLIMPGRTTVVTLQLPVP